MAKTPAQTPAPDDETQPTGRAAAQSGGQPTRRQPTGQPTGRSAGQPGAQPAVQPTEQLPMETVPVSASSSAAGGSTGLDPEPTKTQSVFRRHPLASGIAAAAIAVVVVSGLTAWGVGAAVTASLTSSTASTNATMPMGTPTTAPQTLNTKAGAVAGRLAFRATIQSMDGNSWTILTKRGQTVTVAIDSATQFGTKKATATAGSFSVGDNVIVVAMRGTGGSPTATRVVDAKALGGSATTPTPTVTTTPNA